MHWFESAFVAWESGDIIGAIDGLNEAIAHFSGAALQSVRPPAGLKLIGYLHPCYLSGNALAMEVSPMRLSDQQIEVYASIPAPTKD